MYQKKYTYESTQNDSVAAESAGPWPKPPQKEKSWKKESKRENHGPWKIWRYFLLRSDLRLLALYSPVSSSIIGEDSLLTEAAQSRAGNSHATDRELTPHTFSHASFSFSLPFSFPLNTAVQATTNHWHPPPFPQEQISLLDELISWQSCAKYYIQGRHYLWHQSWSALYSHYTSWEGLCKSHKGPASPWRQSKHQCFDERVKSKYSSGHKKRKQKSIPHIPLVL